ncbi:MAG: hypothetical protein BGO49_23080 [Planctomycetales bacterium 71-10]|nr:MAG: hypothetical protein BGO49_23080 [Planctomycetales bacterium 71-10]
MALLILASPQLATAGPPGPGGGKFAPPPGKTLVAIGAGWDEIAAYTKVTRHRPQGVKFYNSLRDEGNVNFFRHNAQKNIPDGGFLVMETDLNGITDEGVRMVGEAIKEFGGPVFADLEGEFETDFRDRPQEYVAAYRKVHDAWDRLGVRNVAYVWHSIGDLAHGRRPRPNMTEGELLDYYPGDRYVDWFGISMFSGPQVQAAERLVRMASRHGKPVALVEFGHRSPNAWNWDGTWDGWYAPAFRLIESWDIKLVGYSNYGDAYARSPRAKPGDPFADTRMDQMPPDIRENWGRMMRTARFRAAAPSPVQEPGSRGVAVAASGVRPLTPALAPPTPERQKDAGERSVIQVRRISLSLTDTGDCSLSVDTRAEIPPIEPSQGKPATIAGLPNAKVTLEEDGTHRAVYSFGEVATTADFAALNGSPMPIDGLSIDRTAGVLLLSPILVDKGPVKKSSFSFPRYLKAPLSASIDFEKFDNYTVFLTLKFAEGVLQVRASPRHPGWQQDGSRLGATFMPIVNKRAGKESVMLEGRLEPEKLAEYAFRIPADPSVLGQRCELNVHLQGHEPASIARLDVRGRVTPSFGVSLDADKDGVKINAVIRGGASEKAGLKAGDILVSIDGEKVSNVIGTVNRLSDLTAGKDVPFVVKRAGQEKRVVVRGE